MLLAGSTRYFVCLRDDGEAARGRRRGDEKRKEEERDEKKPGTERAGVCAYARAPYALPPTL